MATSDSFKRLSSVGDFRGLLGEVDHVLLDCDGVVWLENNLIGHAKNTIEMFRKHDVGVAFVSNNATSTRKSYRQKFATLGIDVDEVHAVSAYTSLNNIKPLQDHIFTSGTASARYLKDVLLPTLPEERRGIYLIGQHALEEELQEMGLSFSGGTDPEDAQPMPPQDFSEIVPRPEIGVVLASFDMHFNYKKMSKAFNYLRNNPRCVLMLSNDDLEVPLHNGGTAAGEGAIAAPLRLVAKGPVIVAGKPNQPLLDAVLVRMNFDRKRTLMIGDRLSTDITFGNDGNVKTLLVLSGSSKLEDIGQGRARPDYVCDSLGQIADMLEQAHQEDTQHV
ncbi:MAG: hypothetical protein CYPHOPRED_001677 [Cyphobasidiales sp. Tagirdzhanova-0007]|nr:MAG: hypothetical protein CYPHOPRED_001677 [Cyphobasidiales sp. Tagirdzhanova-0007]